MQSHSNVRLRAYKANNDKKYTRKMNKGSWTECSMYNGAFVKLEPLFHVCTLLSVYEDLLKQCSVQQMGPHGPRVLQSLSLIETN